MSKRASKFLAVMLVLWLVSLHVRVVVSTARVELEFSGGEVQMTTWPVRAPGDIGYWPTPGVRAEFDGPHLGWEFGSTYPDNATNGQVVCRVFSIWQLGIPLVILAACLGWVRLRADQGIGLCHSCGYDLSGLWDCDRCPECGTVRLGREVGPRGRYEA